MANILPEKNHKILTTRDNIVLRNGQDRFLDKNPGSSTTIMMSNTTRSVMTYSQMKNEYPMG